MLGLWAPILLLRCYSSLHCRGPAGAQEDGAHPVAAALQLKNSPTSLGVHLYLRKRHLKDSQLLIWDTTLTKHRSRRARTTAFGRHTPGGEGVWWSAPDNSLMLPNEETITTVRSRAKAPTSQMPDWLLQPPPRGLNGFKATFSSHWDNSVKSKNFCCDLYCLWRRLPRVCT